MLRREQANTNSGNLMRQLPGLLWTAAVLFLPPSYSSADELALSCVGHPSDNNPPPDKSPVPFSVMIDRDKRQVLDMGSVGSLATDQFSETTISAHLDTPTMTQLIIIDRVTGYFAMEFIFPKSGGLWEWKGTCEPKKRQF
jgi:hypothetical protein